MHKEMTGSTKTAISLSSQGLTILEGQEGSHPLSAVREGPDKQEGCTPTHPGVFTSRQMVALIVLNLREVLKRSIREPKHLGTY